jgi:N4-gp56 family major capsid protein
MPEITTYGDISPRTAGYAVMRLLRRGQYLLVTERFGQSRPLPKNHTQTIKFRRYESLVPATAPLQEGVSPPGQKLRYTDVVAVLKQYGDVVWLTDVIKDTHEDRVLKDTVDNCGKQAAETIEMIRIAVLKAGSTVFYAMNVSSRTDVNSPPKRGDLRRIVRFLNRRKAETISSIVKASEEISTEPVAPAFFAMCHTDLKSDLRDMDSFTPVENYSNSDRALPGEVGKCEEVRFICTPLFDAWEAVGTNTGTTYLSGGDIPSSASAPDVYPIIIVAKDAYGIVPLQGQDAVTPFVKNPSPSVADPLAQKGFVSWKTWQTAVWLNTNWGARYEVCATANPSS